MNCPAAQGLQEVNPVDEAMENDPGEQRSHVMALVALVKEPAGQGRQLENPLEPENFPGRQEGQTDCPVRPLVLVPAEQFVQVVSPLVPVKVPTGQSKQVV